MRLRKRRTLRIGRRWTLYLTTRFRSVPDAGISRMNRSFCGGFHLYWLCFAVEYDHLSRAWRLVKSL